MQLTYEEIAHIARRRQHLAGQEHKFDARGQLRDGHKFSTSSISPTMLREHSR